MAKNSKNQPWLSLFCCALPALLGLSLWFASAKSEAFADWYALHLYPVWVGTVGRLFDLIPFSAMELGCYGLILGGVFFVLRDLIRLLRHRHKRKKWFLHWLQIALLTGGLFILTDQLGGSINYNRRPFSEVAGFTMQKSSKEELYRLCLIMLQGIEESSAEITRDESGFVLLPEELGAAAVSSMKALESEYPCLGGYYPAPKPLIWSRFLSWQKITGMYSNYTAEANYNDDIVSYNIPMTVCHELSHLKGFMREDEANFIGYLAAVNSEDPAFRYSAYMMGYIYAGNALYGEDYKLWESLRLPEAARLEMDANTAYWHQFDTPVAKVSEAVNDTHLKVHQQTDGVKSYGRVVDLLLEYYREN